MRQWLPSLVSRLSTRESCQSSSPAQSSGFKDSSYPSFVYLETSLGSSKFTNSFPSLYNLTFRSAKRMYYPQTYHHIQEIQKYNIQDYRPRLVYSIHSYASSHTNSLQDGAIPKSDPKSTASPTNAQTARVRLLASRRIPNSCVTSLRHDAGKRTIRRNGEFAAGRTMKCMIFGYLVFFASASGDI